MKKKLAAIIVVLCLAFALTPVSRAAVVPYFMVVNETLMPFNDDNMPLYYRGNYYVPISVFREVGVWSSVSVEKEEARLWSGKKYVDFYTAQGITLDQDGELRQWPSAQISGGRFYVPLHQVCSFFGLTQEIIEVGYDIIPHSEPLFMIRIISNSGINGNSFVGLNKRSLQNAYNTYFNVSPQDTAGPDNGSQPTTPSTPPAPKYNDISIYLSFYDLSAGGVGRIIDSLNTPGYRSCFFVSVEDVIENPGLIRRISGGGHAVGIWLTEGTYSEYLHTSELLFEAAKVKTVIISADEAAEEAARTADSNGLLFWGASQHFGRGYAAAADAVTDMIPTNRNTRHNFRFSCSGDIALILPDLLSFLRVNEYTVARITETSAPIQ